MFGIVPGGLYLTLIAKDAHICSFLEYNNNYSIGRGCYTCTVIVHNIITEFHQLHMSLYIMSIILRIMQQKPLYFRGVEKKHGKA